MVQPGRARILHPRRRGSLFPEDHELALVALTGNEARRAVTAGADSEVIRLSHSR